MERANATEPAARKLAYEILGALKSHDAVPMLIEKLADPDREIAASAATALGAIGDGRAIEPLFAALRAKGKDGDALQPAAGRALGAFGAPVVPGLLESLEDRDELVRAAAASGLGKTRDERAVPRSFATSRTTAARTRASTTRSARRSRTSVRPRSARCSKRRDVGREGRAGLGHPSAVGRRALQGMRCTSPSSCRK